MDRKEFIKKFKQAIKEITEQLTELRTSIEGLTEKTEGINNWLRLAINNSKLDKKERLAEKNG